MVSMMVIMMILATMVIITMAAASCRSSIADPQAIWICV